MKVHRIVTGLAAISLYAAIASGQPSVTAETPPPAVATVTIVNLAKGQILTPAVVYSHGPEAPPLFVSGQPASPELQRLAELGATAGLQNRVRAEPEVLDVVRLAAFVRPGNSASIQVKFDSEHRLVSLASMIEMTNDGFVAASGLAIPCEGEAVLRTNGWDAGSERNTELCSEVPAPCPSRSRLGTCSIGPSPEGFVHVHAGVHGCGGFPSEVFDWGYPLALIKVSASPDLSPPGALEAICSPGGTGPPPSPADVPGGDGAPTSYEPLEGWRVTADSVQFQFLRAGNCISLSGATINGVRYEVHSSHWQTRSDASADWADIPRTERENQLCAHSPSQPGQYRAVADISVGPDRAKRSTENILTVP